MSRFRHRRRKISLRPAAARLQHGLSMAVGLTPIVIASMLSEKAPHPANCLPIMADRLVGVAQVEPAFAPSCANSARCADPIRSTAKIIEGIRLAPLFIGQTAKVVPTATSRRVRSHRGTIRFDRFIHFARGGIIQPICTATPRLPGTVQQAHVARSRWRHRWNCGVKKPSPYPTFDNRIAKMHGVNPTGPGRSLKSASHRR